MVHTISKKKNSTFHKISGVNLIFKIVETEAFKSINLTYTAPGKRNQNKRVYG